MTTSLSASIQPQFQLIDGLNIRYADTRRARTTRPCC